MNIFVLDKDPAKAAQYLIDRHVNKMIVESTQLLTNCYTKEQLEDAPKTQKGDIRKYSHYNHPSAIWVRETLGNWQWLWNHLDAMINERYHRFFKDHFCDAMCSWFICNRPENIVHKNHKDTTPFALAMPDQYKSDDIVESYRRYYINDKPTDKNGKWMMYYTNRDIPDWMPETLRDLIILNSSGHS